MLNEAAEENSSEAQLRFRVLREEAIFVEEIANHALEDLRNKNDSTSRQREDANRGTFCSRAT